MRYAVSDPRARARRGSLRKVCWHTDAIAAMRRSADLLACLAHASVRQHRSARRCGKLRATSVRQQAKAMKTRRGAFRGAAAPTRRDARRATQCEFTARASDELRTESHRRCENRRRVRALAHVPGATDAGRPGVAAADRSRATVSAMAVNTDVGDAFCRGRASLFASPALTISHVASSRSKRAVRRHPRAGDKQKCGTEIYSTATAAAAARRPGAPILRSCAG